MRIARRMKDEVFDQTLAADRQIGELALVARARGLDEESVRRKLFRRIRRGQRPDATLTAKRIGRRAREDLLLGLVPYLARRCLQLAPGRHLPEMLAVCLDVADRHIDDWDPVASPLQRHLSCFLNFGINGALSYMDYPEMSDAAAKTYLLINEQVEDGMSCEEIAKTTGVPEKRIRYVLASYRIASAESLDAMLDDGRAPSALDMPDDGIGDFPDAICEMKDLQLMGDVLRRAGEDEERRTVINSIMGDIPRVTAARQLGVTVTKLPARQEEFVQQVTEEFLAARRTAWL